MGKTFRKVKNDGPRKGKPSQERRGSEGKNLARQYAK